MSAHSYPSVELGYWLIGYGWALCELRVGDQTVRMSASHLDDALGELVSAVAELASGADSSVARFDAEPGEYRWSLERLEEGPGEDDLRITIVARGVRDDEGCEDDQPTELLRVTCVFDEIAAEVLGVLNRLMDLHGIGVYESIWDADPYPMAERLRIAEYFGVREADLPFNTGGRIEYEHQSGCSKIVAYEIGGEYIRVRFDDGGEYTYAYAGAGTENVERMKQLARSGEGLLTFINSHVRNDYIQKGPWSLPFIPARSRAELLRTLEAQPVGWRSGLVGDGSPPVWYGIAVHERGRPAVPEGCGIVKLASPGFEAGWALFELRGPRPKRTTVIPVEAALVELIENAKSYPPSLAVAKHVVAAAFEDAEPSILEFLTRWSHEVQRVLQSQPVDGFVLLRVAHDEPGYLERGSYRWVLGEGELPGTVLWVDDLHYEIHQALSSDFEWPESLRATHPDGSGDAEVELAEMLAMRVHDGQVDKLGQPYIGHCRRVAAKLAPPDLKTVAMLHDVLEDSDTEEAYLRSLFDQRIVDAVVALTRKDGEESDSYYARVRANELALQVKRADIHDNMDPTRLALLDAETASRLSVKYGKALQALFD